MKKKQKTQLIMIAIVLAVVLIITAIVVVVIKLLAGSDVESLYISPNFADQELNINSNYEFSVIADPSDAKLKKLEYYVEGTNAEFEAGDDEDSAVLYTGTEGVVTICVMLDDVESNYLSFNVVDMEARAQQQAAEAQALAEAQAEAEAQAQAETEAVEAEQAEAEYQQNTQYVVITKDKVNIRDSASTDGGKLGQATNGDSFTYHEEVDGWFKFDYNGSEGYVRNDMARIVSETELEEAKNSEKQAKEETAKQEEKPKEEQKQNTENSTDAATQAANQAVADQQAALQAQQELLAQAQAAAAAAAASTPVGGTVIHCTDGNCMVTAAQLNTIHATWDFAGDAVEMAGHHSISELEAVIGSVTRM